MLRCASQPCVLQSGQKARVRPDRLVVLSGWMMVAVKEAELLAATLRALELKLAVAAAAMTVCAQQNQINDRRVNNCDCHRYNSTVTHTMSGQLQTAEALLNLLWSHAQMEALQSSTCIGNGELAKPKTVCMTRA